MDGQLYSDKKCVRPVMGVGNQVQTLGSEDVVRLEIAVGDAGVVDLHDSCCNVEAVFANLMNAEALICQHLCASGACLTEQSRHPRTERSTWTS